MNPGAARPRSDVVFFIDRNLGRTSLANGLSQAGVKYRLHDDYFEQNTPDEKWLPAVGLRGWAVLTADARILSNAQQVIALLKANTHAFVLKAKQINGEQIASAFCAALPQMISIATRRQPPVIARVTKLGRVAEIEGYEQMQDRIRAGEA